MPGLQWKHVAVINYCNFIVWSGCKVSGTRATSLWKLEDCFLCLAVPEGLGSAHVAPRCATCAEFTQRIGRAGCMDERARLQEAQRQHITNIKAHRTIMGRLGSLSEESCTSGDSSQSALLISLDGLDQSKTRWPRNLASSKVLERLWRPQVHLIGYICYGVT